MSSGTVVAFAGHMIDAPDRPRRRFPASHEAPVAAAIARELERLDARVGVSALASGADILFAEAMLARGGEMHVDLPINIEEFLETSVRAADGASWEDRFHALRARAAGFEVHGDDYFRSSGAPFQLTALLIDGHAQMLAQERRLRPVTLAVWDGFAGDGLGGTASFVGHAVAQRREVYAIDPATSICRAPGPDAIAAAQKHSWRTMRVSDVELRHQLAAFLFADAKGFGGLRETQVPAFARAVLGVVRAALQPPAPVLAVNSWGDGLFVVAALPSEAAGIALSLVERAGAINWKAEGLPGRVTFRVGLHAGPAFITDVDPIIRRPNAFGRDVSLAARIEPITQPGEVWCSRAFALLAEATGRAGLRFRDLGRVELAKDAGAMPLYAVTRAGETSARGAPIGPPSIKPA
ncbi:MAG: adenylate/guanylate cyclase domain-containing protein [Phycisphaerales bacterium]